MIKRYNNIVLSIILAGISVVCLMRDTTAFAQNELDLQNAFIKAAELVGPAVVSISTEKTEKIGGRRYYYRSPFGEGEDPFERFFKDFFGELPEREFKQRGLGSGFIIDKDGYILTNEHVVAEADKIIVKLPDGREFKAEVRGKDPRADLAVIKINAHDLPVAPMGDSDALKTGQWAIAIGNPFGYAINNPKPTVTVGVISALNRSLARTNSRERNYADLIQTDAAINPGNSGGPLVDIAGKVIGINFAIFTTTGGYEGIGFAIPVNVAKSSVSRLIEGKKVMYGWLGVNIQDIDQRLADYFGVADRSGVLIAGVMKDSPAAKAGIKEGDIIRSFDGEQVKDVRELLNKVGRAQIGKKAKLGILRNKGEQTVDIVVGERPEETVAAQAEKEKSDAWRGIKVQDITPEIADRYNIEEDSGVIVSDVESGSQADELGLIPGGLIFEINRYPIKNTKDFKRATASLKGDALIRTNRGYVIIKE